MADVALAGTVIASHYAEPLQQKLKAATALRREPSSKASAVAELSVGEPFDMLDNSLGWAWGYAGAGRRVGYVRSEALGL